ncbi:hypothetical protein DH2020_014822 [Rehmannia glutinosa]|uniref:Uncharacterized protein n=1 Tax=Rehmannia glutinosa TaxID=99300 RepID=A0ABR0X0N7_REHGL
MPETASCSVGSRCFSDLRGVQWRVDLGILPSSPSATIDDLRRVTANSRRRYASLRKQLLVDPHVPKDGGNSLIRHGQSAVKTQIACGVASSEMLNLRGCLIKI